MIFVTKIVQAMCDHKDLALEKVTYSTETTTCSAIDYRIFCSRCGKEIVGVNQFPQVGQIIQQNRSALGPAAINGSFDKAKFDKDAMDFVNNLD